jgi:hypothetical protein
MRFVSVGSAATTQNLLIAAVVVLAIALAVIVTLYELGVIPRHNADEDSLTNISAAEPKFIRVPSSVPLVGQARSSPAPAQF